MIPPHFKHRLGCVYHSMQRSGVVPPLSKKKSNATMFYNCGQGSNFSVESTWHARNVLCNSYSPTRHRPKLNRSQLQSWFRASVTKVGTSSQIAWRSHHQRISNLPNPFPGPLVLPPHGNLRSLHKGHITLLRGLIKTVN